MPIEVNCPECKALLRLADEHAGRQARCPSCSAVFTATANSSQADSPSPKPPASDASPASDSAASPPPSQSPTPSVGGSAPSVGGPASVGPAASSGGGSPATGSTRSSTHVDASNPYAPTFSETFDSRAGNLEARRISLDAVYSNAWRIFKDQWVMACVAVVIVGAINFGMNMAQNVLIQIAASMVNEQAVVIGLQFLIGAVRWVLQLWLQIGQTMVMLDIARGREINLAKLFGGGPYLLNTVLAVLLVGVIVGAIALLMVGIPVGVVGLAMQDAEAAGITAIVAVLIAITPIMIVSLMFSQIQLLIIDRGVGAVESLRESYAITNGNKLTLFVIGILLAAIGMGAAIVGLLALCVGIIPAMIGVSAFGSLVFVISYLFMTGQQVSIPRSFAAEQPNFRPSGT